MGNEPEGTVTIERNGKTYRATYRIEIKNDYRVHRIRD
jgi:hypothetical protein